MDKDLRVALFPMRIAWEDKKANFDTLQGALESMHPDTDLIILPETFSTGFPSGEDKDHVRAMAERNSGPTVETLKRLAALSTTERSSSSLRARRRSPTSVIYSPWPESTRCSLEATTG